MSKSGKKGSCGCGCGSKDDTTSDPCKTSRNISIDRRRSLFPTSIKSLLILIAEDDDDENRVDIVLDACSNHCFIEDARVIAVMDNTVVIKDDFNYRFVCISCICEVIVDCDTILEELFEENSFNRG
ncbi:MAG: hypothetical protein H7Y18_19845 [Clostridiaceae bacterium]|nr:hypothetical protein [Clostridiaceae bacterium]